MEHKDETLGALVDKLMDNDALESPALDFTAKVMELIEAETVSKAIVYKPLISKPVWTLLGAALIALVAYIYMYGANSSSGWLDTLDFSLLPKNPLAGIDLGFSKSAMYAVVLFAVMMGIQIPVLKHYFNKRMGF